MKLLCDRSALGSTVCGQVNHLHITQTTSKKMECVLCSADIIIEGYQN